MTATDKLFAGSIPELYDRLLVPLIFERYAQDLASRIAVSGPQQMLETAAGTGVLTSATVSRLPAQSRIVATDLNQPMLDRAASRRNLEGRVAWRQADALALPFKAHCFDAVACQFGVMFFPDKVKGYSEARRVLRPRGRFSVACPGKKPWRCLLEMRPCLHGSRSRSRRRKIRRQSGRCGFFRHRDNRAVCVP